MPARPVLRLEETTRAGATVLHDESGTISAKTPPDSSSATPASLVLPGRYVDLGPIAGGAFGDVRRVYDTELGRTLAMKLLHAEISSRAWVRRRFLAEVQVTAQLQHPGIVPVYDHGELSDGRLWYVMKEVRGRTLGAILDELFAASGPDGFRTAPSGWTFRRVADVVVRIAQTVAYAHASGVVHRDLKPDNVMVGEHGEVMVMDWGLSRRLDSAPGDDDAHEAGPREERAGPPEEKGSAALTRHGDVLGTPAYMPPEQARGARDLHGPASDVYALGAILYHALTGRPPYEGGGMEVVRRIVLGPPPSIEEAARGGPPVPADLAHAAGRAMSREIKGRCSAEDLARDVLAWLDGVRRREEAVLVLEQARALTPEIQELRERSALADAEARELLSRVRPFDPVEAKRPAWAKEDEGARLGHEALLKETEWLQGLHSALRIDPELPEAHALLADHYRSRVSEAESRQRPGDAARFEVMLRAHDRGQHAAFLRGEGALTLVTDPPGAEVSLHRYVLSDRRLARVFERDLGTTPLRKVPLSQGSYLLRVKANGRTEVQYPVLVQRDGHWDGCAPGESEPTPIALPAEGELGADECYVPAGWCQIGGDPEAPDSLPSRKVWVDGLVIGRFPVKSGEYLAFLNDLVAHGLEAEAVAACPRRQLGVSDRQETSSALDRDVAGRFLLPADWDAEMPVVLVDWRAASAHARWVAQKTSRPVRLLNEIEREKAARGVDGRLLPWGHHPDPTFACALESHQGQPARVSAYAYPADESPYAVRGLAGNTRDWCLNVWKAEGPPMHEGRLSLDPASPEDPEFRVIKGGMWSSTIANSRAAARFGGRPELSWFAVGFRLARSWGDRR